MKKLLQFVSLVLFAGCAPGQQIATPVPEEVVVHQLSATSEVRSVDTDLNEYLNHALGVSIKFPKRILENPYGVSATTVPVKIIENGEVITFSRGYVVDPMANEDEVVKIQQDFTVRHPYYKPQYLDDLRYPYQIYLAKAETFDDVKAFVERVYGEGCTVIEEEAAGHIDRPGYKGMVVEAANKNCENPYHLGDYVQWYSLQKFVSAKQPGWTGNFKMRHLPLIDEDPYFYFDALPIAE